MLRHRQQAVDVPVRCLRFLSQKAGSSSWRCWTQLSGRHHHDRHRRVLPLPLQGRGSANSVLPRRSFCLAPARASGLCRGPSPRFPRAEPRLGRCHLHAPVHTDTRAHTRLLPLGDFCWTPCHLLREAPWTSCFTGQSHLFYFPRGCHTLVNRVFYDSSWRVGFISLSMRQSVSRPLACRQWPAPGLGCVLHLSVEDRPSRWRVFTCSLPTLISVSRHSPRLLCDAQFRLHSSWRSCWLGWCSPHPTRTDHGIIPGTNFHAFDSSPHPHTTPVQHRLRLNLSLINKLMLRAPLCGAMEISGYKRNTGEFLSLPYAVLGDVGL